MLVRVRSSQGTFRLEVEPNENFGSLTKKIATAISVSDASTIALSTTPTSSGTISAAKRKSLGSLGIRHGDILFVTSRIPDQFDSAADRGNKGVTLPNPSAASGIKQDLIDDALEKHDGLIKRTRDAKFCTHGASGMCDYCMPLEPYDATYLEQNKIKHMSLHAYLRKLTATQKQSKPGRAGWVAPLDEPSLKVAQHCTGGHEPWPRGICTKCQPSAVTLQRQSFRLVDHVEFSSASLIEHFIQFWRTTGFQRFGYLYGRYEPYLEVPLGIKAVVEAIYEPPQENDTDSLQLRFSWAEERRVDELAKKCGMVRLGSVFTDLLDDQTGKGTVVCKRHVGSYFLSSQECVFAAQMQIKHPSPCRWSSTGTFGSKFLTCVVSGQEEGGIDVTAYQVSNVGMAMTDAGLIEPSVDPSVMRVKDANENLYVPEVFYKYKNEYDVTVQASAKPCFPVDYLLVNVTHGFPQNPSPLFTCPVPFPMENRGLVDHQDLKAVKTHFASVPRLADALSDFHVLAFLESVHVLTEDDLALAAEAATRKSTAAEDGLRQSPTWQTLMAIVKDSDLIHTNSQDRGAGMAGAGHASASGPAGTSVSAGSMWSCRHCTFSNRGGSGCEMCGLPRDQ